MAKEIMIYSENNDYQFIETIRRNRTKRHRERAFFVEGVNQINALLESSFQVRAFYYSRERKLSRWAGAILDSSRASIHYSLPEELMKRLSEKEEVSELVALVNMPAVEADSLPLKRGGLYLLFDRPGNRGNLGTIMRSADSFGCDGLIISGHSVDIYDPETIRASLGAFFSLPFARMDSTSEVMAWAERVKEETGELQIVGTTARTEAFTYDCDFRGTTLILLGNETKGLSAAYRELAHSMVKIPIFGTASSLNVACAASIVLYEASRQRLTDHT